MKIYDRVVLSLVLGGCTPSYFFAYTCVWDQFIGEVINLAKRIIR